jgi:SAM-dependent methyltransferase
MILDVGSGHQIGNLPKGRDIARGDVNIDIEKPARVPKNFVRADAHNLPFINNFFEKVYFYDVIEHVENPSKCLREIYRVLRADGELEISKPNQLHWRSFFRVARGKKLELGGREHIATWMHIEMEILLEKANFKNVKIHYDILKSLENYGNKHFLIDKLMYKIFPSSITGLNMIVTA